MKNKIVFYVLLVSIVVILFSEFSELIVVMFSDKSSTLASIHDSYLHDINKYITLSTLPVFALILAFGVPEVEKTDKYVLIFSTVFYIILRIIVLEIIMPYDYQYIMVDKYFTSDFYVDTFLVILSYTVIFGALYYVANNKLQLSKHWLIFCAMVVVEQIVQIIYPVTLNYFFNRNISIPYNIYKVLLLAPSFLIRLISGVSSLHTHGKEDILKPSNGKCKL